MRPFHLSVAAVMLFGQLVAGSVVARDEEPKQVEVSLIFLTEVNIASIAVDADNVVGWLKPVMEAVERQFANETTRRTVVLQVTLHPDRPAEVVVAGRPAATAAEVETLLKVAAPSKAPRSRAVDCSFRVVAKVNGGAPDESGPLSPSIQTPDEQWLARFRAAPTAEKLGLMKNWARTEAIPILTATARQAEPEFPGVRNLGKTLGDVKPEGPIDVAALADKNPEFWRAMLEMAPGNPLIPATLVALHVANGDIDRARRIARAAAPFDRNQSGYSRLVGEFGRMSALFYEAVEGRVREGIELNDKGEFDEALKVFDGVLKDYPKSAWAHYERFHTIREKSLRANAPLEKPHEGWPDARKAILDADPLYSSMAEASGPDEIYGLLLRKETETLFKERDKFARDLVRYADIALDLGQPGLAAVLYWNTLSAIKPELYGERNLLEDVLYSVEQLGIKDIKDNFRGDHAAEFKRIDAERARRKRESPASRELDRAEPEKAPRDR